MSVLYAGVEDIDVVSGACTVNTTSGMFRSGYARCVIYPSNGTIYMKPFLGGAVTSCWISSRLYKASSGSNTARLGLVKSGSGGKGLWFGQGAGTNKAGILKYDGSSYTVLQSESGNSLGETTLRRIDAHITNFGASASVDVYVDSALVISYSGDLTISGAADLDQVAVLGSASSYWAISELVVADEDTRAWSVVSHYPSGTGDTTAWTSGAYTDIDETSISYSDILNSTTADQDFLCALSNLPAGTFVVNGVRLVTSAVKGASGIGGLSIGVKSGATTDVDLAHTLTTAWAVTDRILLVNPATNAPFTQSELDALQLALRSAS